MKRTPLYERHVQLFGKMVDFGGWELPVQYSGILAEHEAVRSAAGLFDVSHMGEIDVKGRYALDFVQRLVTGDVQKMADNQVLYAPMCYEDGGVVDDLLVYRYNAESFLLVVNASNTDKDFQWIVSKAPEGVAVNDRSSQYAQLAVQGPKAEEILQELTEYPLNSIAFFRFADNVPIAGVNALVSRTGYTGEDGFELYLNAADAPGVWDEILKAGADFGLVPAGLGARDTLRFEASLPLYGHELSPDISPLESGLSMFVKLDKGDFIGRQALLRQKENGIKRELIGFAMTDRGIARGGYEIMLNDRVIGHVTSGSFSPTLKQNLGLAIVERGVIPLDGELFVVIREKPLRAKRIALPFYKKRYRK